MSMGYGIHRAHLRGLCCRYFLLVQLLNAACIFGCSKIARHTFCSTGPSTMHTISDRFATSAAGICICRQNRFASAIVAPYTTRSTPAHSASLMHIGQGSHVVYSV